MKPSFIGVCEGGYEYCRMDKSHRLFTEIYGCDYGSEEEGHAMTGRVYYNRLLHGKTLNEAFRESKPLEALVE